MYGFRTRTPILRFFCTCSVPVLAFENHYVPVPFTHQCFIFNPYPFRPRTWFFKTNPYPYQCRLVLLRFRTPYPYPYLKYQGNYSSRRNKYIFETAYQWTRWIADLEAGRINNEMIAFICRMLNHENNRLNSLLFNPSLLPSETNDRNRLLTLMYALWARLQPFHTALMAVT